MNISRVTVGIQVKGDWAKCFDFYVEKMGFFPTYGDRNQPDYANFATEKDCEPFFGMSYVKAASEWVPEYKISNNAGSTDTMSAVFHTDDFESEYSRLEKNGVEFIGRNILSGEGYSFNIAIFSDPEGNLLSLEDGGV